MKSRHRIGFEEFYSSRFGERWPGLRDALCREPRPVARPNAFPDREPIYYMDEASIHAARALDVLVGDRVLDLCAAPGGKTLILAEALAEAGRLVANDRSATRRARLLTVLREYLPPDVLERVQVTGHDAEKWCLHERDAYDRILLDAPCSSEGHVLRDPRALAEWTPARITQLARRQYAMLASALQVVRVGGRIVYSTCALIEEENDSVVQRLLDRRGDGVRVLDPSAPMGRRAGHGWEIHPDRDGGRGPIYFCVLERVGPAGTSNQT